MEKIFFFDIDDTLYDLADPFRKTCEAFFKDGSVLPVDELFLAFRKHGEVSFTAVENGQMTMREMYCYRLQKAFGEYGIELGDEEALAFQKAYQKHQPFSLRPVTMTHWCVTISCTMWRKSFVANNSLKK